uniref:Transposase MuDR plant domain-containing protein n=1 Tax=Brassica oleracea var. oleracea TaxID=109376 RepID=A0A0D3DQ11_BRAOL
MIKTKFTRNGREVMIWGGALRTFDYGSEEAVQQSNKDGNGGGSEEVVQQSKKGGKGGDGSVSEPKRSAKKGGKRGASRRGTQYGSPVSSPEKVTRCGTPYGGSTPSPRQSKKQKVTGGSTVSPPENSKKNQVDGDDREECLQRETNEMNPPSEEEEFGNIEDDCRRELEDSRLELENENGIAGIEEENCRDLGVLFGDEARNDDYDENEEEMILAQAYRADIVPEELLQLGKTFSDAEDFKHTCLRYTLKTRYNIKYYRSSSLKMGAKCAAEMRDYEDPCPWMVYCSYDKRKHKLMVKTYVNDHKCEKTGHSRILKRSAIARISESSSYFPEVEHRQCCHHIYENWRKGGKDLRLQRFFWFIARSYTPGMFNYNMDELKNYDPGAHASLIKTKPETWSRAFFKIGSYCNDNLNNLCESFNKTIREARKKPLLDMSEEIRRQCMTRNYNRSKMATDRKTRFTKKTHKELGSVLPKNHDRKKGANETRSTTKLSRVNRVMTCSNCKEEGHYKNTCKNASVPSPPKKPRGRPRKYQGLRFEESQAQFSQAQSSQAHSSQAQASRWEVPQSSQASQTGAWRRWFS